MTLQKVASIPLPVHRGESGFDHAAVDAAHAKLFVAHTANDAVDVIDLAARKYERSIYGLTGVAGVWTAGSEPLLFTSNRGEDTASIFRLPAGEELFRVATGSRPNGMAFDPNHKVLLVAGVGNAERRRPPTATLFDVRTGALVRQLELPGRTRWAIYNPYLKAFLVNISSPAQIAVVPLQGPESSADFIEVPASGPHGLEQSPDGRTLYCACDDAKLVKVDLPLRKAKVVAELAGPPDVLWMHSRLSQLYVAIGDPGVVQMFRTDSDRLADTLPTAEGAHTLTVDPSRNEVHVFLPDTHEDLVLRAAPDASSWPRTA